MLNLYVIMHKILYTIMFAAIVALASSCGRSDCEAVRGHRGLYPDASLAEILSPAGGKIYESHLDSAPDSGCVRIPLRPIGHLRRLFNDSNSVQLVAARQLGVNSPSSLADAWRNPRELMPVRSCADFYIDELRHSYPYLVPEAAELLHDIGAAFNDSLAARGGGAYRIKVTSLLRTPATVGRLRRVNRNAVGESTHTYGTTFDISYSRFICDSITTPRTFEDLKNLLGEVLLDFKKQGRCYVKMERRQACFHITVRPS